MVETIKSYFKNNKLGKEEGKQKENRQINGEKYLRTQLQTNVEEKVKSMDEEFIKRTKILGDKRTSIWNENFSQIKGKIMNITNKGLER